MSAFLIIIGLIISKLYFDYQIETEDKSIQGFIEYLKEKFYYKKKD